VYWSAAIGGWALGWAVGIAEIFTVVGGLVKFFFTVEVVVRRKTNYKSVKPFYKSIGVEGYATEDVFCPADVSETTLAGIASWIGRGIGFVVSTVATAIASIVAYPIYLANRYAKGYKDNIKENDVNEAENKNVKDINGVNNDILEKAATKSLNTKGERSQKTYEVLFNGALKPDEAIKTSPKPSAPGLSINDEFSKSPQPETDVDHDESVSNQTTYNPFG